MKIITINRITAIALFLFINIVLAGCAQSKSNSDIVVEFPVNDYAKTEFSSSIYDIDPFSLTIKFPDSWSLVKQEAPGQYAMLTIFSKYDILNENNKCVGVIGYNIYDPYDGPKDDPRGIYSQIALGNDYQFDVRNNYNVVTEFDYGTTAIVDVYYAASINNGNEKINKGIVSYNNKLLVYIAAEFDSNLTTDEQIRSIANSVNIK